MKKLFFSLACLLAVSVAAVAEPSAAPAVPAYKANQVKAVYAETYGADCGFGEWGSGTQFTQDTYGKKFVTGPLGYFGLTFEDNALNCSAMESLHLDVWSDADMSLRIVPIHGGAEVGITKNIKAGEWNAIDIALAEFTGVTNWTNVFQIKIDNVPSRTFWVNNVYFYTSQAVDDDTQAPTDVTASLVSAEYFTANIKAQATDNSGAVVFDVLDGETLLATKNAASAVETAITVTGLKANTTYALSVVAKDETGNAAAAVTIDVTTKAAPAPAPAPDVEAANVISVYSDAYEAATRFIIGNWEQPTKAVEGELTEGEKAYYMYHATYIGWELQGTPLDITGYTAVHMDIYPLEGTSVKFSPIWGGESLQTVALVANQWNAVDIPLSRYPGMVYNNIYQLKWDGMPATMFLDNVYFYKEVSDGISTPAVETSIAKFIENGHLVIIRDGVRYNALGQVIE